jgi:A/G-specific adenine glycosylase
MKKSFTDKLLKWNEVSNKRIMPWKGEKDPYKIWLSEIILQQTRVEQGLTYYEKFLTKYETIIDLANAPDEEVFKLWEGLGYYSRCKNLLHTARTISVEKAGAFPTNYEEILKLKGIGAYTAAAIASFAYGLPYAVLDGNVFRVLSRYFGKSIPIDSTPGKIYFAKLAQQLLFKSNPAIYNQALMDFGATVCKPQLPECEQCVFKEECVAFKKGWVNKLPIKEKKLKIKGRLFYYFIFSYKDQLLVNQRLGKDIWQSLYDFYLYETSNTIDWEIENVKEFLYKHLDIEQFKIKEVSKIYTQQLTHQKIKGQFISIELFKFPQKLSHLQLISKDRVSLLSFPQLINQHLKSPTRA